jgi:hypothetical protein
LRIERRLGDAGADVRPRDEGCVAEQQGPSEHELWRFQVEDRLHDGLFGAFDQDGDLRRQYGLRSHSQCCEQFRPDQRRWNRNAVATAACVGAQLCELLAVADRTKPTELTAARRCPRCVEQWRHWNRQG